MGKIYIICPDCGKPMSFNEVPNWENRTIECIRCHVRKKGNEFLRGMKASDPNNPSGGAPAAGSQLTERLTPSAASSSAGRLRVISTGQTYNLFEGCHIVGRKNDSMKSDFEIDVPDKYMSRRNVQIDVVRKGGGFAHHLVEINAKNTVKINGRPVGKGDILVLHYGNVITLGNTDIILENVDKDDTQFFSV